MPKLNDRPIDIDDIRAAGEAIEMLVELRGYLPASGDLMILAGRFRDDVRELLGMPWLGCLPSAVDCGPLSELDDKRYSLLDLAVGVLVDRYTPYMDDPELPPCLRELRAQLQPETERRLKAAEGEKSVGEAMQEASV